MQSRLHLRSPPQRFSLFSSAVTWSESGIGAIFVCLSAIPSCVIVSASGICRPLSSCLRLRDQFAPYLVSLVSVSSRLSWHPFPGSAVRTGVCGHATRRKTADMTIQIQARRYDF